MERLLSDQMASTITHFTHQYPNHYLNLLEEAVEFECGACKVLGSSGGYKCNSCSFMLHGACASISSSSDVITSFMHPQHGLTLLTEHCQQVLDCICDICGDCVRGMWYRCAVCNLDVHPLCSKLPQFISDPVHAGYLLRFTAGRQGARCCQCRTDLTEWHYRCDGCNFNCHFWCLLGLGKSNSTDTAPDDPMATPAGGDQAVGSDNAQGMRRRKRDMVGRFVLKLVENVVTGAAGNIIANAFSS